MLLWSYSPHLVKLRKKIDCDLAVYFRTDDYLSAPGVNVSRLRFRPFSRRASSGVIRPSRRVAKVKYAASPLAACAAA